MKSLKVKFSLIISLALAFIVAVGVSVGLIFANADRPVTVSGASIFNATGGAAVWAHREGEGSATSDYTMLVLRDGNDAVTYKKNLAFNWVENSAFTTKDDELVDDLDNLTDKKGHFSMEIGFEALSFEKFVITFESQQYSQTKDNKTTNYLFFVPSETAGKVDVFVATKDNDDENAKDAYEHAEAVAAVDGDKRIKIELEKQDKGEYELTVNDTNEAVFKNIGGNYAKYSSSSTTPVTPLSFTAEFAENAEDSARMVLYALNGQSFKLTGAYQTETSDKHYAGGTVNDTTAPVLCLDKGLTFIEKGKEISFDYTVIDVLASSPSATTSYFMLTKDQEDMGSSFNANDITEDSPYRAVKSDDDQLMIPHVDHYIPVDDDYNTNKTVFGDNCEAVAAVKIYLKLTDTSSTGGVSTYVLLDWYIENEYKLFIGGNDYIAVATDEIGITFDYNKQDTNEAGEEITVSDYGLTAWTDKLEAYQNEVDEAAKDLKAGNKNYFYLPSVESLFTDNVTKYPDLTFSIYYNNGSQQSNTGKAANALSINLTKAGDYEFTVYATDAAGNKMYYFDKNGEKVEIETGDIWNMFAEKKNTKFEDTKKYLPWFNFTVNASEFSIEDPGEQNTAYVGTDYSIASFDINGVSYGTDYSLYLFKNSEYYKANGKSLTYEEFMEQKEQLFKEHREYFKRIKTADSISETDEDYEEYCDYEWNSSSLKFVPQDANAFYLVVCTVTSSENGAQTASAYMGISASPRVRALKGEDTWLQDNMVSVILLCIAGASLIGIVLLLVIKPKNNGDLDEAFEKSAAKEKAKNKKK